MTDTRKTTPPVPGEQLHDMLSALLSEAEANSGALHTDSFWHFVTAVAQGRGITECLHEEGVEAMGFVPASPRTSYEVRKERSYHIALLLRLLLSMGREGQEQPDTSKRDGASILPGNFNVGVVASDLLAMLEGHPGARPGRGQLLTPPRQGEGNLRAHARRMVVGTIHYRAVQTGQSNARVRDACEPYLDKSTWERWQKEFGGPKGAHALQAQMEAEQGKPSLFDVSDETLSEFLEKALSFPGRGHSE